MQKLLIPLFKRVCVLLIISLSLACRQQRDGIVHPMEFLEVSTTGIDFINQLSFDQNFNGFNYRNYYNGGGVAIGDINNDGLPDIYFTANQQKNRLYLNKGDFQFEDITDFSKVGGSGSWSTGVSMVDINSDGLLDIYVCNSGTINMSNKQNELFINNGDLTFTESAHQYNLADTGFGTHASFFDYDKDGDLDVYILNNSYKPLAAFDQRQNPRQKRDYRGGDKLMKNENGVFVDVSEQSGIYSSEIGFGLGVAIGDMNGDNWDDIFVSNDFFERDYLYINQKDGTFQEELTKYFQSISLNSMGADMADVNNDGINDLFVTDMLPRDNARLKSKTSFMNWNKAAFNKKYGYHHQFSRNVFQLSTPAGYKEVGRYAGVEATDWSWGALIFDLDNDGLKDIFVANGIYQDLTDLDYINYISNEKRMNELVVNGNFDYQELSKHIPSSPIANNFFKNVDGRMFHEKSTEYGLDLIGFSNGAAYGDLDNDGDLDLVVNNVNAPASVYKNNTNGNSISLVLRGTSNTQGIGSKILISTDSSSYHHEQQLVRGFQSSVDSKIIVGLASNTPVDIKVNWPEGKVSYLKNIEVNQTIEVWEKDAVSEQEAPLESKTIKIFKPLDLAKLNHVGNNFVDFDRDRFLFHKRSTKGPKLTVVDYNEDGEQDVFYPGGQGENSRILSLKTGETICSIKGTSEIKEGVFLDVNSDSKLDLVTINGSVKYENNSDHLHDFVFLNNEFSLVKDRTLLNDLRINSETIATSDIDGDGDLDVFIGEGSKPSSFGEPSRYFIFENLGNGSFNDVTEVWLPSVKDMGIITDALFADINGDERQDLIVTGEFMGIYCFLHTGKQFSQKRNSLTNLKGWWNTLHVNDLDNDGDLDIVAGNHGLNSIFKATENQPITLFINDYDNNGYPDPILTRYDSTGEAIPYAIRNDLIDQIAPIKKLFPDFKSYETASIQKMFTKTQITNSKTAEVSHLESMIFINNGDATFLVKQLPMTAQLAPIYAISSQDYDHDGDVDLLLGGNLYGAKPQAGRYDATNGIFLRNEGNSSFVEDHVGFHVKGEIRDIITTDSLVIVSRHNDSVLFFSY